MNSRVKMRHEEVGFHEQAGIDRTARGQVGAPKSGERLLLSPGNEEFDEPIQLLVRFREVLHQLPDAPSG